MDGTADSVEVAAGKGNGDSITRETNLERALGNGYVTENIDLGRPDLSLQQI